MKITIPRLFELFQLPEKQRDIEPLVSFINGAVEQLVKALQLRLTLRDNAYAEIREITFKKNASNVLCGVVAAYMGAPTTTATIAFPSHGLSNGDRVLLSSATDTNLNGSRVVSAVTTNTFQVTTAIAVATDGTVIVSTLPLTSPGPATAPWTATFTPEQRTVEGMLVLQTRATDGNTVQSWRYEFLGSGALQVSIYPRLPSSSTSLVVKFAVLFQ